MFFRFGAALAIVKLSLVSDLFRQTSSLKSDITSFWDFKQHWIKCLLDKFWLLNFAARTYGHLPPITKTIQARRTRHAGHCWRSNDELVSDVLMWTPAYGQSKAGRPARTFIQQLCDDTGCNSEDLPKAMNDREAWRERVRDIRADRTTWWWWWWW